MDPKVWADAHKDLPEYQKKPEVSNSDNSDLLAGGVGLFEDFKDKSGREWEWFIDDGYYHMTCVRPKGERKFESPNSFHFATSKMAQQFVNILREAS